MNLFKTINVAAAALTAAVNIASASDVRVIDGDTIEIAGQAYRLHGIDAPEAGQRCADVSGGTWQCGKAAISAIEALVLDADVVCDNRGIDDYGRILAVCFADGVEVNAAMIENGMAWAFTKYSADYVEHEWTARGKLLGIWQAPTETAWDYRAQRWEVGVQIAPEGCPIKGNISRSGRIYHAPWSPWYDRTKVSVEKGERWFCNEAEALEAGWRAPYWGR